MKFEELGLSNQLLISIKRLGFDEPTQIQEETIPAVMNGKDVLGESATGSGKTLAFGCAIIEHTIPKKGVQALVVTPTRELAEQVKDMLKKFSYLKPLRIISIYGGVAIEPQMRDLEIAEVVVGTPGRLLDHLERGTIDLSHVKILVLDEADRMLDMGFIDDVEYLIKACPKNRQTLFFSATLPPRILKLSQRYTKNAMPVRAEHFVDPNKLKQFYYDTPRNLKLSLLIHLLKKEKSGLSMLFCSTRRNTDFVAANLKANGINAVPLHGGLSQNKRLKTIKSFNDSEQKVLVCTDVASRGLDINNVEHVYNYDMPKDPKDYVHRIGRTARAGKKGEVINILCDHDYDSFSRIEREYSNFNIKRLELPHITKIKSISSEQVERNRYENRRSFNSRRRTGNSRQSNYHRSPGYGGHSRKNTLHSHPNSHHTPRGGRFKNTRSRQQNKFRS